MNLDPQQETILYQRIIRLRELISAGRVTRIIQHILKMGSALLIMFLSWICYLTLVQMRHIIFGDGGKKKDNRHLLQVELLCVRPFVLEGRA